jgi:hypothetical protein
MGKIVYHGTFSEHPPHEYGETFHAGTKAATEDRIADEIMGGEVEGPAVTRTYGYEIPDTAPMSRRTWSDPDISSYNMFGKGPEDEDGIPPVPEYKTNRIYPYTNVREDRGSTSYVIPSGFVGRQVKNLGLQFQGFVGTDEQFDAMTGAMRTMLGGKK